MPANGWTSTWEDEETTGVVEEFPCLPPVEDSVGTLTEDPATGSIGVEETLSPVPFPAQAARKVATETRLTSKTLFFILGFIFLSKIVLLTKEQVHV